MKPIARIVRRDSTDDSDGLILGAVMKSGKDILKKGVVYEISEYEECFVIRPVGKSCLPRDLRSANENQTKNMSWENTAGDILGTNNVFLLTTDEFKQL